MEGKISAAIKFLEKEHSAGVLDLNPEVIEELKEKHPAPEPAQAMVQERKQLFML